MNCEKRTKYEINEYGEIVKKEAPPSPLCKIISQLRDLSSSRIGNIETIPQGFSPIIAFLIISQFIFTFILFLMTNNFYSILLNEYLKGNETLIIVIFSIVYALFLAFILILINRELILYTAFVFILSMTAFFTKNLDSKPFEFVQNVIGTNGLFSELIVVVLYYAIAGILYKYLHRKLIESYFQFLLLSVFWCIYLELFFESIFLQIISYFFMLTFPITALILRLSYRFILRFI